MIKKKPKIWKKILKKYPKTRLILHVAETKKQEKEIKNKFGKSSIMFLYKNDLLNDRTILIHGNWIDNKDLNFLKKSKASLVHCLSSNLKVADRTLNLKKIVRSKIKSCIATDGVVTSGTFDMTRTIWPRHSPAAAAKQMTNLRVPLQRRDDGRSSRIHAIRNVYYPFS